ncbi:MAG: ABC transporter ATP-binding protein [Candidatus Synoicihabitans palmerolidicus]|nr:ABC transporter ATP-binding protein [Candidatus Synoicihabitans palmerolidicus]
MVAPPPPVHFNAVTKHFGDGPAVLDAINFTAREGDFIAVIGPSGCGKSTLLRLIAGLTTPSSGSLSLQRQPPVDAVVELAFVFQEPTLLPWARVAANVALPLRLRGVPSNECADAVHRCLTQVRLADRADAFPRQLSGGQQMRVSIARALALNPKLLLLDEPFGALDEMTRNHLNEELLTLREQAVWTAFFVTHSISEAVFLANRVLVMSAHPGRIQHEVTVDLPYPRTAATRQSSRFLELTAQLSQLLHAAETPPA